jgi:hypothetical protein
MTKNTEQRLKDIAQAVNERLPEGFGYIVMDGDKDSGKKTDRAPNHARATTIWESRGKDAVSTRKRQRRGRPEELTTINDEVRKI